MGNQDFRVLHHRINNIFFSKIDNFLDLLMFFQLSVQLRKNTLKILVLGSRVIFLVQFRQIVAAKHFKNILSYYSI